MIDCGNPNNGGIGLGSAIFEGYIGNSSVGSSFRFTCEDLYTVRGLSSQGDDIVRCGVNGHWDYGGLRCEGQTLHLFYLLFLQAFWCEQ